jgi:hypothetical protein
MILRPLPPAVAADIADDKLVYGWDEWNVPEYYAFVEDDFDDRMVEISGRGAIALTLAVGEWICQRFSRVDGGDPAPMQFLESAWAEQMQPGLGAYIETDDDHWRGVIRGPLSMVITIANDAVYCMEEDDEPGNRAAWMTNLARHVLPSGDAFERWLRSVIDRLTQQHPKQGSDRESLSDDEYGLGRPVARDLFDTARPYLPADESLLIARFLSSIDPQNPFLSANQREDEDEGT